MNFTNGGSLRLSLLSLLVFVSFHQLLLIILKSDYTICLMLIEMHGCKKTFGGGDCTLGICTR